MNDTIEDNPIAEVMGIIIEHGLGGMNQAMIIAPRLKVVWRSAVRCIFSA